MLGAVPYSKRIAWVVTARKLMSVGAVCHAESELTPGLQHSSSHFNSSNPPARALRPEAQGREEVEGLHSVPMLSMDLEGNRARELGAMRSAEVAAVHLTLQFLNLADDEIGFQCEATPLKDSFTRCGLAKDLGPGLPKRSKKRKLRNMKSKI